MGSAMGALHSSDPDSFTAIRERFFDWPPLNYLINSVASSIALADTSVMKQYATLVEDEGVRKRFMDLILAEYERTQQMLEIIYDGPLSERRPYTHQMMRLRQEGLWRLHRQQIEMLRKWRQIDDQHTAEKTLLQLLLTVNAIAGGLGATG